jgi:multidrug efflux pump subunit AcrA (membrane-fusion protein)
MFVSRNGSAVLTPVEVGDRYQRMVEIRSGVTEQDTVLISGHTTLTDGARIAVTVR